MLLTKTNTFIIGPVATLLGFVMNAIFIFLSGVFHVENIGLCIILFTIIIYAFMTPLTVKQQKFSKLSAKMNPEIQAIQKKYNGKKDNDSVMAMNQETQAVYAKYGVSPTGSCVQLLIQMPILMALYRVIYAIPAYVGKVKEIFVPMAEALYSQSGIKSFIEGLTNANYFSSQFKNSLYIDNDPSYVKNVIIDSFNRASTAEWQSAMDTFKGQSDLISKAMVEFENFNNFLGLNIANSPSFTIKTALADKHFLLIIGALMIPVLAALTQWINTKLMPQPSDNNGNSQADTMNATMKSMNTMMPIMSAVFCFSFPSGVGIYWIAGAVIRSIQQVVINKKIDKEDVEDIIKKNADKAKEKAKKRAENAEKVAQYGSMSTKTASFSGNANLSKKEKEEAYNKAMELRKNNIKPGSLAAKANLVNDYNERNNKGDK